MIRYPNAVRPWQHVLDCLSGYLLLTDAVLSGEASGSWNFGPGDDSFASVKQIAQRTAAFWGPSAQVVVGTDPEPHEAGLLTLDSTKARTDLAWSDRLSLDQALEWTVQWEQSVRGGSSALDTSLAQIERFSSLR